MNCCQRSAAVAVLLGLSAMAQAQAPLANQDTPPKSGGGWWSRIWRDYHRNQAWPDAFIPADRAAVNLPFAVMADNGWQRQNLLCDYHFGEDGQSLSPAGEYRLNWIATQAPQGRRVVFVQRGASPDATVARVDVVQNALAHIAGPGPRPRIVESNLDTQGFGGEEVDAIINSVSKSRPDPHIPDAHPTAISN